MGATRSDSYWSDLSQKDLYWAVRTSENVRSERPGDAALDAFFKSGREHIERVVEPEVARVSGKGWRARAALDFGCGVGRVLIPLAETYEHVVGIDVSEKMLAEAKRTIGRLELKNVELAHLDRLSELDDRSFDLVHSYIVLQHIAPQRGLTLLGELVRVTRVGGVLAVQIPYAEKGDRTPFAQAARRIARAVRRQVRPSMEMYVYNLNAVIETVRAGGVRRVHLRWADQPGYPSVMIFGRRGKLNR